MLQNGCASVRKSLIKFKLWRRSLLYPLKHPSAAISFCQPAQLPNLKSFVLTWHTLSAISTILGSRQYELPRIWVHDKPLIQTKNVEIKRDEACCALPVPIPYSPPLSTKAVSRSQPSAAKRRLIPQSYHFLLAPMSTVKPGIINPNYSQDIQFTL